MIVSCRRIFFQNAPFEDIIKQELKGKYQNCYKLLVLDNSLKLKKVRNNELSRMLSFSFYHSRMDCCRLTNISDMDCLQVIDKKDSQWNSRWPLYQICKRWHLNISRVLFCSRGRCKASSNKKIEHKNEEINRPNIFSQKILAFH